MTTVLPNVIPNVQKLALEEGGAAGAVASFISNPFTKLFADAYLAFDAEEGSMLKAGGGAASSFDSIPTLADLSDTGNALHLPGIADNTASFPNVLLDPSSDWSVRITGRIESLSSATAFFSDGGLFGKVAVANTSGDIQFNYGGTTNGVDSYTWSTVISPVAQDIDIKFTWDSVSQELDLEINGVSQGAANLSSPSTDFNVDQLSRNTWEFQGRVDTFVVDTRLDIDFNQPKGTTSFTCSTGQAVTVNQSGSDPARIGTVSDAIQTTGTDQPLAIVDRGLFCPGVDLNAATVASQASLDISGDITLIAELTPDTWNTAANYAIMARFAGGPNFGNYGLTLSSRLLYFLYEDPSLGNQSHASTASVPFSDGTTGHVKVEASFGTDALIKFFTSNDGESWAQLGSDIVVSGSTGIVVRTNSLGIGSRSGANLSYLRALIHRAQIFASTDGTDKRLDIDFTDPAVADGATSFVCDTAQTVTVNRTGDNPATLVRYARARTDGTDDWFGGKFADTIDSGRLFMVISRLGLGSRLFSVADISGLDIDNTGLLFSYQSGNALRTYYAGSTILEHTGGADGRFLHEVLVESGNQKSFRNNTDEKTNTVATTISAERFGIASNQTGGNRSPIDLLHLSLFPATITEAEAARIREFLNNRYNLY